MFRCKFSVYNKRSLPYPSPRPSGRARQHPSLHVRRGKRLSPVFSNLANVFPKKLVIFYLDEGQVGIFYVYVGHPRDHRLPPRCAPALAPSQIHHGGVGPARRLFLKKFFLYVMWGTNSNYRIQLPVRRRTFLLRPLRKCPRPPPPISSPRTLPRGGGAAWRSRRRRPARKRAEGRASGRGVGWGRRPAAKWPG